ncbi:hypothetical protein T02_5359 [Trichinella nativa]|uniref:Uncharacterized protein n=1 Tax=Trichinella nativa TaxID=6335 RepID=A0A0V1LA37_9BILA|nr:hypothetical protein T09_6582 [Trichinella sp. T9]KRZ56082.1 hypothetical protein T02_5359 [Trichinella nativa]
MEGCLALSPSLYPMKFHYFQEKPQSPKMDFQGINPSETIIELQQTCPDGCLLRISRKYCGQTWMLAMHGH